MPCPGSPLSGTKTIQCEGICGKNICQGVAGIDCRPCSSGVTGQSRGFKTSTGGIIFENGIVIRCPGSQPGNIYGGTCAFVNNVISCSDLCAAAKSRVCGIGCSTYRISIYSTSGSCNNKNAAGSVTSCPSNCHAIITDRRRGK